MKVPLAALSPRAFRTSLAPRRTADESPRALLTIGATWRRGPASPRPELMRPGESSSPARTELPIGIAILGLTDVDTTARDVAARNVRTLQDEPTSILWFYRRLIALRRSTPALTAGAYEPVRSRNDP